MRASKAICVLMFVALLPCQLAAQNIEQIKNADPLVITGAVGTKNTYRYTSGKDYASPLNSTIYANLNINVYGFAMPFSLYYVNNNFQFNYPLLSFSLHPTYKYWTGYFGENSMAMSSYVMSMSFTGIGFEYNDKKRWRGGAFYGRLRKAINDDPTDPLARSPQYRRVGWGVKAGYGTGKNYIDMYLLYAFDCLNSLDERWFTKVSPHDNVVLGFKGCVTPFKWMNFTANAATSVFSTDTRTEKVPTETAFDKVFDVRYSTLMRFAGDANMNLTLKGFNTSLTYKFIQPDYTSLGNQYMSNNYQSLGISTSGNAKNVALFERHRVFSAAELRSRYEILLENYVKVIHIEAQTLIDMVSRNVLPAVSAFSAKLCENARVKAEVAGVACGYEKARCREISRLTDEIYAVCSTLGEAVHHADAAEDTLEKAMRYKDDVVGAMNALRQACDSCESMMPAAQWPYPSYTDMLFSVK